jgi:ribosomal protein L10
MANQQKVDIVAQAADRFKKSQGVYFTKYTGMSALQYLLFVDLPFKTPILNLI